MFQKAYEVALYAKSQQGIKTPTSKDVKSIGLKSEISNQILRKYYSNKTIKTIKIENLKGIAKKNTKKYCKESNFTLNSWPFYKFKEFIKYKAFLSGVSVIEIDPSWTSQNCFRCGLKGNRERKLFKCLNLKCRHVDHADVNAAFNIAFSRLVDPIKNEIGRRGEKAKASPLPMAPSTGNGLESDPTRDHLEEFQDTHH